MNQPQLIQQLFETLQFLYLFSADTNIMITNNLLFAYFSKDLTILWHAVLPLIIRGGL